MKEERPFIPAHGNYPALLSYKKSEIVFDITHQFCRRFLSKRDRTVDQMIQAARSGKQNIVEATRASGTSKETEIKLLGVARASLEELLTDYYDFLRVHKLTAWNKESAAAKFIRRLGADSNATYNHYRGYCETRSAHVVANIAICAIHQTNYLLDRQLRALERDFVADGGLKERMSTARRKQRISPKDS